MKGTADLLRAAEHLRFGALNPVKHEKDIDAKLVDAIAREFRHKLHKAQEQWSEEDKHEAAIEAIFAKTMQDAQNAFDAGAYRRALELVRAAEALASAKVQTGKQLEAAASQHPQG